MASIKTSDLEVQLFVGTDPYRADVDNRPLRNLIANDLAINTELTATTSEVVSARSDSSTGTTVVYSSLDARLEALGLSNAGNASVSYAIFQAQAERNRALFQSGWLAQPSTKSYAESGHVGFSGDDFSGLFGSQWLGQTTFSNSMFLNADFDGQYVPIPLLVNGWLIKLLNLQAGGASAYGSHNVTKLTAPPTSGGREDLSFLEVWLKEIPASSPVFWYWGSPQFAAATYGEATPVQDGNYTIDPLDPRVVHTLSRLPNGNWLQVQHRIRVVPNVNATNRPDGFTGSNATITLAQGGQAAPVTGKNFTNMLAELADAGLWRAGAGAGDSSTLSTYDGYVYAVPISMVHRRASEDFTMANQNGSKRVGSSSSGTLTSAISGRPDGKYYDSITRDDYIDMRQWVDSSNVDYDRLLQRSFNDVVRGATRLQWQQLQYTAGTQPVFGNRLLTNDTIFSDVAYPLYATDPNLGSNTNYVVDKSVSLSQFSKPDGTRRRFDSYPVAQRVTFLVDAFALTSNAVVSGFVTVSSSGGNRIVTVNPQVLSGGTGNTVAPRSPTWSWLSDGEAVNPVIAVSGATRTYTFPIGSRSSGKVLCNVEVLFPAKSGTTDLPDTVVRQEYFNGTATKTSWSSPLGTPFNPHGIRTDSANRLWVAEFYGQQVSLWTEVGDGSLTRSANGLNSTTVVNWSGGDGFSYLTGVAVIGDPMSGGSVWVADYINRRVRKYTWNGTGWALAATVAAFTVSSVANVFGANTLDIDITADGTTLFVSDWDRHCVFKFSTSALTVAVVFAGVADVPGASATYPVKLHNPHRIKIDPDGTSVWVSDFGNYRLLKLDSTAHPQINITTGTSNGGGGMDGRIKNGDCIKIIGTPGTGGVKYLVQGGTGIDSVNQQRVFRLDSQFNVEAISSLYPSNQALTRLGEFDVDDEVSPNYVFVGIAYSPGGTNDSGLSVLRYSDLGVVVDRWNFGLGNLLRLRYIPAVGAVTTPNLFAYTELSGLRTFRRFGLTDPTKPNLVETFVLPSGVTQAVEGHISKPQNVAGIGWCFYETLTDQAYVTRVYRWTQSGSAWVRGAATIDPLPGTPWGLDLDSSGHLYVAFPGITGLGGVSDIVYRYKWNGSTAFIAPGASGNTPGTFGVNGVTGSSATTISTPEAVHVSADGTRVAILSKTTTAWSSADISRIVLLDTTTTLWENSSLSPYAGDTINQVATITGLTAGVQPFGIAINADDLYVATSLHSIYKFTRTVTGDPKSYQFVGRFGVEGESGTDHAHLYTPVAVVLSSSDTNNLIIGDFNASRLLSVNTKMAGVSNSSGNVETMVPLGSSERLRIWSNKAAYQGVGKQLFSAGGNEFIWTNQVLSASDFLYVTTLGRSPLVVEAGMPIGLRAAIERLPLCKTGGVDSSQFDSTSIELNNIALTDLSSPFLKLPTLTYGSSGETWFDGLSEDSFAAFIRDDAGLTSTYITRGYFSGYGGSATTFKTTLPSKNATQQRLVIEPYLIKRQGRVYLMIITVPMISSTANVMGHPLQTYYHAVDLFEVPGRLLLR